MPGAVLVDTSVRVRHFRQADPHLQELLTQDRVLMHSRVHAELAYGTPSTPRAVTLASLALLRACKEATTTETLHFLEHRRLYGQGWGFVDLSLLASTLIMPGATLWTADRRLADLALQAGIDYLPPSH